MALSKPPASHKERGRKGGKIGGRARTAKKARAARVNGRLGGTAGTPAQKRARRANMKRLNEMLRARRAAQ